MGNEKGFGVRGNNEMKHVTNGNLETTFSNIPFFLLMYFSFSSL